MNAATTRIAPSTSSSSRLLLKAVRASNHVERARFDLFVDPPDVLADRAEDDQLDAADERHDDDDRRPARHDIDARVLRDAGHDADDERDQRDEQPEDEYDA